ncbi:tRNA pseudouridine synthase [Heracleum sosnowskyi]|uniref:tRNA pseudouridine synthase n=1 Tax=Heracleum sosnowskyi TaxID=360622 RepID=A0AAD8GMC9_9APIA|nr:tRNA pseudouridine synthase [Heracleum sosnowskyi]
MVVLTAAPVAVPPPSPLLPSPTNLHHYSSPPNNLTYHSKLQDGNGSEEKEEEQNGHSYKWRLLISYDGTRFSGWQYQKSPPTIQCLIEQALTQVTKLERKDLCLVGASRTDAGVHAWGQVAHFFTPFNYDSLESAHAAMNGLLPPDIRVREFSAALPEFHARFSVRSKIYLQDI